MLRHIVAPQALNSETPVSAYVWHLENIIVIMKKEEEDPQGPGKPCELIIRRSQIECQDQFLNATTLCFISSLPDSEDFAVVHVVLTSPGKVNITFFWNVGHRICVPGQCHRSETERSGWRIE